MQCLLHPEVQNLICARVFALLVSISKNAKLRFFFYKFETKKENKNIKLKKVLKIINFSKHVNSIIWINLEAKLVYKFTRVKLLNSSLLRQDFNSQGGTSLPIYLLRAYITKRLFVCSFAFCLYALECVYKLCERKRTIYIYKDTRARKVTYNSGNIYCKVYVEIHQVMRDLVHVFYYDTIYYISI